MRKSNWLKLIKKFKGLISYKRGLNNKNKNKNNSLKINNNIKNKKIIRKVRKGNGVIISKLNKGRMKKDIKALRMLSINIRKGILTKIESLKEEFEKNKPDIICIQEVGLRVSNKNMLMRIFKNYDIWTNLEKFSPNFENEKNRSKLVKCEKSRKNIRRGVMILVNKELSNITEIKKVYKDINNRVLVLKLKNENFEIMVGNIYAPAEGKKVNQVWLKNLSKILSKLKTDNKCNLILGGDWNVNLLSPPTFFLDFSGKLNLNDIMRVKFD